MKCFDCKNKNICKFVENTESVEKSIQELNIENCSPVRVRVECNSYVKSNLSGSCSPFQNQLNNQYNNTDLIRSI